ncbi:hypothetical protein FKX85_09110 [Echinicola soli]|uniref:NERD domain-containing protein n=1 Tax=Echinicola soli TaxID=2591634 RepID=A0A514CH80_9BACT|nr:NERD domain-containing protein [Echinicola soli]QDH79181.1 hypothetical protein FKX85_09110 [Echinicola soli]
MDAVILSCLILLLYLFYFFLWKRIVAKAKGAVGEYKVSLKLRRLKKGKYLVLNDLLIKNGHSTTQIDHVVISRNGIFVIETKNYKGWIHGHQNSEYWTQTIYKYKTKLSNPIKQNWVHVHALKKTLSDYKSIHYYPIVVFTGDCELKNITSELPIIYLSELLRFIKRQNETTCLSYHQMRLIRDRLNQLNLKDRKEVRGHTKYVRRRSSERRKKIASKICPNCNSQLVLKKGSYGKFYGCPNFPNCRFTAAYQ